MLLRFLPSPLSKTPLNGTQRTQEDLKFLFSSTRSLKKTTGKSRIWSSVSDTVADLLINRFTFCEDILVF
ncbi:hypothetical protein L596_015889 [Steinernema carpocapsae]|uniref:Uncharacterized protein n=1 Tax=Steinernema carpocapsae TaxID=34508 RepID=A0A4U5NH57_STECR|nr:hypothetical protein L596_015889 [Steinernema carpocapsae]